MYNWLPFPFLRITLAYIAGIISAIYLFDFVPISYTPWVILGLIFTLSILYLVKNSRLFSLNIFIGASIFLLIAVTGFLRVQLSTPSNLDDHIVNCESQIKAYTVTAIENSKEREKTHRVLVEVETINADNSWTNSRGKIYLYLQKDSSFLGLEYGDQLIINGSPSALRPPQNPHEFDYKQYVSFQGIYFSHYVQRKDWKIIGNSPPSRILKYSNTVRSYFENIIKTSINNPREQAIALALILGVKDGIDDDLSNAYAAAGAMHVLAVSGLHVGVIFFLVGALFGNFKNKPKWKWAYLIMALTVLWSYAFVTGLSSSVLRAVTMFSFVVIGNVSNRQSNIYNTLAVSAFVLLCFNPFMIMSVGFQLSFLAVFGIVYLQPKIYTWFSLDNYFIDKIWQITSVSIAAQIATAPLVVLYFHQLPTYFFISNLVVIPGAFVILCSGILLLVTNHFSFLNNIIGDILEGIIYLINEVVFFIHSIPFNTIDNIYITTFQSWCILIMIIGVLSLLYFRKFAIAVFLIFPVLGFSGQKMLRNINNSHQKKIVFYNIKNEVAIDFIEGDKAHLFAEQSLLNDSERLKFHVAPNRLASDVPIDYSAIKRDKASLKLHTKENLQIIVWNGVSVAVVGRDFNFTGNKISIDYLYLLNPTNRTINQIKDNFEFQNLVINGNTSYLRLDENNIANFHPLGGEGALSINLE